MAGAKIAITNLGTNIEASTTTNDQGIYRIPGLQPGIYRITLLKDGFKSVVKSGIELHVQDVASINFELQLGSVTETVTVEGGGVVINTTDASVSTVVDRQFVENIPLNGRSFQTLLLLTPGVVVVPTNYGQQGQFSVNGQRADTNYYSVDGVSANNGIPAGGGGQGGVLPGLTVLGSTQSMVSLDAMQEFRIQTSTFAPEFGRTPGAQIGIVSRSGSNQWHGSLFEYFRNDVLDANNWFSDRSGLPKPQQRQNDFGGVLGGPVRREHTFFFLSYEGLRLRQPLTVTTLVPSNTAKALLPASMKSLVSLFPATSNPDLGNGTSQLTASFSNPVTVNAGSVRIDHNFGSRLTLFGRYSDTPSELSQRNLTGVLSVISPTDYRTRTVTLGLTELISSHINNEVRANYSNSRAGSKNVIDSFGGATPQDPTMLFQSLNFPEGFTPGNSSFGLSISSLGTAIVLIGKNGTNEQRQVNFVDTASVVMRSHQFKTGIDYRWLAPFAGPRTYGQVFIFSEILGGVGTLQSGTASVVAITAPVGVAELVKNFSFFAQDTWKVTPRLTLTYGLRWEVNPPFRSKDSNNPLLTVAGLDNPATMTLAPAGTPEYATTWANIAPRLGVAYSLWTAPNWATLLRGGIGLFYDLGSASLEGNALASWPFSSSRILSNVAIPLTAAQALAAPHLTTPPVNSTLIASVPDLRLPRTWQFNVAMEQLLGAQQSLTLNYVGAIGRKMIYAYNLRAPNPSFPSLLVVYTNRGTSDYHALQAKFQRRLVRGVQALASYTWSHSLDTGSDSATGNPPQVVPDVGLDRGDSDFDIRHSFSGAVIYDVPSPTSRFARTILGGWSLNDFIIARSAPPVSLTAPTVTISGLSFTPRPNLIPGQPLYLYGPQFPGGFSFNRAAFQAPTPAGTQGNFGRNGLRGFGAWQMDFSIRRQFHMTERLGLQFSTEFFNILNHPNFGQPVNTIASALFGQSTSTLAASLGPGGANGGFYPLYQIGGPRSIQFAARITF